MQKKLTVLFAFAIFVLVVGLQTDSDACNQKKNPKQHGEEPPCNGNGNGDNSVGGSGRYSVDVIFGDFECGTNDPNRDHFCSDGLDGNSPYDDADDDVSAVGDKFRFSLTLQSELTRQFFLDFSDQDGDNKPDNCFSDEGCDLDATPMLDGGPAAGFTLGPAQNVFSTGEATSLLDIKKGSPKFRNFWINFRDTEGTNWVVAFDPLQCNDIEIDLVSVKRIGDIGEQDPNDTWEIEATDSEYACLQRQEGGHGPKELYGRYTVPFKLLVTRKQ